MNRIANRAVIVFLLTLFFYTSPALFSPFSSRGQAREAVVVENMFQQDNLILPLRNGIDIPSKPPLFHWFSYAAARLSGGLSEAAVRAPSLIAAAATVSISYYFVGVMAGAEVAAVTAVILGSTIEWIRSASVARVDMVFAFFLSWSFFWLLSIVRADVRNEQPNQRRYLLLGLPLGCAILTKGPTGLLIPLFAAALYLLLAYGLQLREMFRRFPISKIALSIGVAVLVSIWWYVAGYYQGGRAFLEVSFLRENVARVIDVEGFDPGHKKPFYFSAIDFAVGFLPWSLLAIPLLMTLARARWIKPSSLEIAKEDRATIQFAFAWIMAFVIAVAVAASKRTVYLIPAYPALAFILSFYLTKPKLFPRLQSALSQFVAVAAGLFFLILSAAALMIIWADENLFKNLPLLHGRYAEDLFFTQQILKTSYIFLIGLSAALAGLIAALRRARSGEIDRAIMAFGLSVGFLTLGLNYSVMPKLAVFNSPQSFVAEMKRLAPSDAKYYYYRNDFYSVIYYAGINIPPLVDPQTVATDSRAFLVLSSDDLVELQSQLPNSRVALESENNAFYGKGKLVLLQASS